MSSILNDLPRGLPSQDDLDMHAPKARWYAENEILSAKAGHYSPDKIFLGKVGSQLIGISDDRHMLTIAGSRAGKGRSCIIPNLLHYSGSVLVIDPKGENANLTAVRRKALGQSVHVLDPFGRTESHFPDCVRPA